MHADKYRLRAIISIMVTLGVIAAAIALFVVPGQATARATMPRIVLEANDRPEEAVQQPEAEADKLESEQPESEPAEPASELEANRAAGVETGGSGLADAQSTSTDASEANVIEYSNDGFYTSNELALLGVIHDDRYCYTWYSQRVLPGGGLDIEGRHVSEEGYVVDGSERIVVASSDLPWGTEVEIPFGSGTGIVLDTGCAPGVIDIYTDF